MRDEASVRRAAARFVRGLCLLVSVELILAGCSGLGAFRSAAEPGPALQPSANPVWYAENAPLIKAYLETLSDAAIGKPLPGIRLSDGELWLEGYLYLGRPQSLPMGLSVRLVKSEKGQVYAYLWVKEGAPSFALEACESGPQEGIRARQAGGGAYTWKSLSWEHGVVYTECPPEAWLPAPVR